LIELSHVSVSFGRPILRDVSLSVPKGVLLGLVGPGAAGKSILLKTIAGLITPQSGSVALDGTHLTELTEAELMQVRERIGMLFQNNALFDFLTVAENIAFPLRQQANLSETEILERVEERLAAVGLPGFGQRLPSGLSGGQKKRVGLARATVAGAEIFLYDEPAAGLDPVSSQKLFDLLRREQQAKQSTVVMVSSDLDRLRSVTDQIAMMLQGELIFVGSTESALSSRDPYVKQFLHGHVEGPL
jgi:phospholipid/cholesterol/gamma-HCH transport system ATP-binding protein